MGKILRSGDFKPKPSAVKSAEWMQQEPLPMRSIRKSTEVRVFMGAGWQSGKVVQWTEEGVTVWLARAQRNVVVRDNRNLKIAEPKRKA